MLALLLNTLATLQLVWVYLEHVPSALNLVAFEQGAERTPFQYRVLLMPLLRWAHQSLSLNQWAVKLSALQGWFPQRVHPEAFVEAAIDVACVLCTGLITRRIYHASSRTGMLTPYAYPLTLVMIAATYTFQTMHSLRFVYDFPSMALFGAGVYLLYFRCSRLLLGALFIVATLDRETSIFLLPLYLTAAYLRPSTESRPRTIWQRSTLLFVLALTTLWIAWHLYVVRHYAHNPSASGPRLWLNLGIIACPIAWPQLLSTCAYLWPFIFLYRRRIPDPMLRACIWLLPPWFIVMLRYGLVLEPRIFGELIVIAAPAAILIAESLLLDHLDSLRSKTAARQW